MTHPIVPNPIPLPQLCHNDWQSIGRGVRNLRKQQGLTLERLAEKTGCGITTVQRFECGITAAGIDTVCDLASALGVTVIELIRRGTE